MQCAREPTEPRLRTARQVRALEEKQLRLGVRGRLRDWAELALAPSNQVPAAHHLLLIERLERVARGEIDRLMLLLPPGSAKSTYASMLFPAWWFSQHPNSSVIAAAHTGGLARHFGRGVKTLIEAHSARLGYGLQRGASAERFATDRGGQYYATGVRGAVTGRRADLLLIDDPVKSQAEADDAACRERLWQWFRSDLSTRLRPGGRIVLIMTRWHPDDLGGRLMETDDWQVLRLPALAEAGDPLGREVGAPLWPGWESLEALQRKRRALGERAFAALFQQSPVRQQGLLFRTGQIGVVDACPQMQGGQVVRAWDLAATAGSEGDPDWTAGGKLLRCEDGGFVVLDVRRVRVCSVEVAALIVTTAQQDGREVAVGLPQDPGQAGKAQVRFLTQRLAGFRVVATPETGSKLSRAVPVASQVEAGLVKVVQAEWTRVFVEELADFPNGSKDDQVDALSRGFSMLTMTTGPARFAQVPFLGR
jgi:predicted phage terminase large subunit-like protein